MEVMRREVGCGEDGAETRRRTQLEEEEGHLSFEQSHAGLRDCMGVEGGYAEGEIYDGESHRVQIGGETNEECGIRAGANGRMLIPRGMLTQGRMMIPNGFQRPDGFETANGVDTDGGRGIVKRAKHIVERHAKNMMLSCFGMRSQPMIHGVRHDPGYYFADGQEVIGRGNDEHVRMLASVNGRLGSFSQRNEQSSAVDGTTLHGVPGDGSSGLDATAAAVASSIMTASPLSATSSGDDDDECGDVAVVKFRMDSDNGGKLVRRLVFEEGVMKFEDEDEEEDHYQHDAKDEIEESCERTKVQDTIIPSPHGECMKGMVAPRLDVKTKVGEERAVRLDDIPQELLEHIFGMTVDLHKRKRITKQDRENLAAICGVSKRWRHIACSMFYKAPWDTHYFSYLHPNQLFALSPKEPRSSKSGLLKCFVKRTGTGLSQVLTLYFGKDPDQEDRVAFLCTAVAKGRNLYEIYLSEKARKIGVASASLRCNLLCTSYRLTVSPSMEASLNTGLGIISDDSIQKTQILHPEGNMASRRHGLASGPMFTSLRTPLLSLQYRARIQGLMQPRRMEVKLGHVTPNAWESPSSRSSTFFHSRSLAGIIPWSRKVTKDIRAAAEGDSCTQLHNKSPHWNDGLKCWCLNFRGRVKLASVKNFQLVESTSPSADEERVIMQFGKVQQDLFILDFNPTVMSAMQAFATALSTFNGKVML